MDGDGRFVRTDRPADALLAAAVRHVEHALGTPFADGYRSELLPQLPYWLQAVAGGLRSGAMLFIDYGYVAPQFGSTFQAVRAHRQVDPFAAPGEADLTAHVDFGTLIRIAESRGVRCYGVAEQGAWLHALGIDHRAGALAQAAPDQAGAIEIARARLTEPAQMGSLFKVMGLASPRWPDAVGF